MSPIRLTRPGGSPPYRRPPPCKAYRPVDAGGRGAGAALEKAREYLTALLEFRASAVNIHVVDEPDPNLQALA